MDKDQVCHGVSMKWPLRAVQRCIPPFQPTELLAPEALSRQLSTDHRSLAKYLRHHYGGREGGAPVTERDLIGALFCQTRQEQLHPITCRFAPDSLCHDVTRILYSGTAIPPDVIPTTIRRQLPAELMGDALSWHQVVQRNCRILELAYSGLIHKDPLRDVLYASFSAASLPQVSLDSVQRCEHQYGDKVASPPHWTVTERHDGARVDATFTPVGSCPSPLSHTTTANLLTTLCRMAMASDHVPSRADYNPFADYIAPRKSVTDDLGKPQSHYHDSLYRRFHRRASRYNITTPATFCQRYGLLHWPQLASDSTLLHLMPDADAGCGEIGLLYPIAAFEKYLDVMKALFEMAVALSNPTTRQRKDAVQQLRDALHAVDYLEGGGWVWGVRSQTIAYEQSPEYYLCYQLGRPVKPYADPDDDAAFLERLSPSLREFANSGFITWQADSLDERRFVYESDASVFDAGAFAATLQAGLEAIQTADHPRSISAFLTSLRAGLQPYANTFASLFDAMVAMFLRDLSVGQVVCQCEWCGTIFIANTKKHMCPPSDNNPAGCAGKKAKRKYAQKTRQQQQP